jgi:hypothetical protein
MEDLNVPSYRRDPSGYGKIVNMSPGSPGFNGIVQNPTSAYGQRPTPNRDSIIPDECYGVFLMIWCFLGVFSKPLRLTPFNLSDFENTLHYHTNASITVESISTLLNVIIAQRDRLKKESQGHGSMALAAAQALYGTGYQSCKSVSLLPPHFQKEDTPDYDEVWNVKSSSSVHQKRVSTVERGCGSVSIEEVSERWDRGFISADDEREGWVDVLIGFLNQVNI